MTDPASTAAFPGNAAWTGYDMISGHWYKAPGQAVVPTGFLTDTGKSVGDTVTLTSGDKQIPARIVGEVFDPQRQGARHVHQPADPGRRSAPDPSAIRRRPAARHRPDRLRGSVNRALPPHFSVTVTTNDPFFLTLSGLIGTLVLLIALVAGLGVLNTVVLDTRDRVHDLGVFKAIGMTPRQTIAMVVCWVAGTGLVAGVIAVPAGMILHRYVLPEMASAAGTGIPASYLNVFRPAELLLLPLAGMSSRSSPPLLPASWAARARTASALRAE